MTLDDIKHFAAHGNTTVHFHVRREEGTGRVLPIGEDEQALIDMGVIWYQYQDDRERHYLILTKNLVPGEGA